MKKIYTTILMLSVAAVLSAQTNDTLTAHFQGTASLYGASGGGFVAGHNAYLDKGKMQLFDANYGVSGAGVITGLLMWIPWVEGNPNSVLTATIWQDNAGAPGTVLGTVPVTFASIDTSAAGFHQIMSAADTVLYNAVAVFPSSIAIPGNMKFWAGITFTYAAGDTIGMVTTTDATGGDAPGSTGDFPDATSYTFEKWSDNTFHSFNDGTTATWELDIALAIFPTVTFGVGINEAQSDLIGLTQNFPNPFSQQTNISYSLKRGASVSVEVFDMTGRTVMAKEFGYKPAGNHNFKLDAATLNAGVYFYTLKADGIMVTRRMTVAK
jgi:Secretion system C-terminal sorting domain